MTRTALLLASLLWLALAVADCAPKNDESDEEDESSDNIGAPCAVDADCEGMIGGVCAGAGVCTRSCGSHAQCGCAYDTTNADILAGRCRFACVDDLCTKSCRSDLDCAGDTDCQTTTTFDACL